MQTFERVFGITAIVLACLVVVLAVALVILYEVRLGVRMCQELKASIGQANDSLDGDQDTSSDDAEVS
jgi:hypothetical protein